MSLGKKTHSSSSSLRLTCFISRLRAISTCFHRVIPDTAHDYRHGTIDSQLLRAAKGGYIDVIELLIRKGANDWNYGLYGACRGGSIEAAKLMIRRGANQWTVGFWCACCGGSLELVKLMIEMGADRWDVGWHGAKEWRQQHIVEYLEIYIDENQE